MYAMKYNWDMGYETVAPYAFVGICVNIKKNTNKYIKVSIQKRTMDDSDSSDDDSPGSSLLISSLLNGPPSVAPPIPFGGVPLVGGVINLPLSRGLVHPVPAVTKGPVPHAVDNGPRDYYIAQGTGRIAKHSHYVRRGYAMTLSVAISIFKKRYKHYTGNVWGEPYTTKKDKYKLQNIDDPTIIKLDEKEPIDEWLEMFIKDIYPPSMLNVSRTERKRNDEYPLGKVNIDQLRMALKACHAITPYLDGTMRDRLAAKGKRETEIDGKITEKLHDLTHEVLTNIPIIFGTKSNKICVIDSLELLEWYKEKIMTDISISFNDSEEIDVIIESVNVTAEIYSQFKFDLSLIDQKSSPLQWEMLTNMIVDTMGPTHKEWDLELVRAYGTSDCREYEDESIFFNTADHRLLFHGTTPGNLIDIMKSGLHVPGVHQIQNGTTLGKGIYFADCITKSFQYCLRSGRGDPHLPAVKNKNAYMLVCEVALGRTKVVCGVDNDKFSKHLTAKQLREYEKRALSGDYQSKTAAGEYQCTYKTLSSPVMKKLIPSPTIEVMTLDPSSINPSGPWPDVGIPGVRVPTSISKVNVYSEDPIITYNQPMQNRDGTVGLPIPVVEPTTTFHYNEYCIYDKNQYRIRYVMMLNYTERK